MNLRLTEIAPKNDPQRSAESLILGDCPLLLKFGMWVNWATDFDVLVGGVEKAHMIKAENYWRDGRPQVTVHPYLPRIG